MTHEGQNDYKTILEGLSGSRCRVWKFALETRPDEQVLKLLSSYVLFLLKYISKRNWYGRYGTPQTNWFMKFLYRSSKDKSFRCFLIKTRLQRTCMYFGKLWTRKPSRIYDIEQHDFGGSGEDVQKENHYKKEIKIIKYGKISFNILSSPFHPPRILCVSEKKLPFIFLHTSLVNHH